MTLKALGHLYPLAWHGRAGQPHGRNIGNARDVWSKNFAHSATGKRNLPVRDALLAAVVLATRASQAPGATGTRAVLSIAARLAAAVTAPALVLAWLARLTGVIPPSVAWLCFFNLSTARVACPAPGVAARFRAIFAIAKLAVRAFLVLVIAAAFAAASIGASAAEGCRNCRVFSRAP